MRYSDGHFRDIQTLLNEQERLEEKLRTLEDRLVILFHLLNLNEVSYQFEKDLDNNLKKLALAVILKNKNLRATALEDFARSLNALYSAAFNKLKFCNLSTRTYLILKEFTKPNLLNFTLKFENLNYKECFDGVVDVDYFFSLKNEYRLILEILTKIVIEARDQVIKELREENQKLKEEIEKLKEEREKLKVDLGRLIDKINKITEL
jgi:predicted nuclease with TOPRIM domain